MDPGHCSQSDSPFNSIAPTNSGAPETSGSFTMTYGARAPVTIAISVSDNAGARGVRLSPRSALAPANP